MKKIRPYIFFAIVLLSQPGIAQPSPFQGTLLFNICEKENSWSFMPVNEVVAKNVRFLSDGTLSTLRYDSVNKAFSYTSYGFESKWLAIVYNEDTSYIDYPSSGMGNSVCIRNPVPLNGKSFSFYNEDTYDAMLSNCQGKVSAIFYLCAGCFISQYQMTVETKKDLKESRFLYQVKLAK